MKILAIDGNSILNRAYYGIRKLTNKNGVYTNAVFGFLNIYFKKLLDFCGINNILNYIDSERLKRILIEF